MYRYIANASALQEQYELPLGYSVKFGWSASGLQADWSPTKPTIKKPRIQRKFLSAYLDARDRFLTNVATSTGSSVGVASILPGGEGVSLTVIEPATKH